MVHTNLVRSALKVDGRPVEWPGALESVGLSFKLDGVAFIDHSCSLEAESPIELSFV